MFEKVSVEKEIPKESGKYIVFTKTGYGNENVIKTNFNPKGKAESKWGCNSQTVTHWLKEL